MTTTKTDFVNITLIYWKNFACNGTARTVDEASSMYCQHRTGEEQVAAEAALSAIALADKKLVVNILRSEMHQPETPGLSNDVKQKSGMGYRIGDSGNQMIEEGGYGRIALKPSM